LWVGIFPDKTCVFWRSKTRHNSFCKRSVEDDNKDGKKMTAQSDETRSTSIMLHIRRTVVEDAFVAVPVTSRIMKEETDGTAGLDWDAFVAEAVRIGGDRRVEWQVESSQMEPHPAQVPLPEDGHCFDAYYDSPDPKP
jgi:hypothetical protein